MYIYTYIYILPKTVTHPSTNRARRDVPDDASDYATPPTSAAAAAAAVVVVVVVVGYFTENSDECKLCKNYTCDKPYHATMPQSCPFPLRTGPTYYMVPRAHPSPQRNGILIDSAVFA